MVTLGIAARTKHQLGLFLAIAGLLSLTWANELSLSQALLQQVQTSYGQTAVNRLKQWQQLVEKSQHLPESEKLKAVNTFFNQLGFVNDIDHWKKEDYWATPVEFMASGAGDCEDFSIAKYFTLRLLGVADKKMRITYVKALSLNQAHMVLSYFPEGQRIPLVLDNLIGEIVPASQRKDLLPVYNFNGDGLWLAKQRGEGKRVGKSTRISLWVELRERMLKQQRGEEL
ncbi:transglutaminase-like cysteine peptidase [Spartinivicinus marinus]|uniref:transglutaminase-like cysteine peptidase n=1 Tax=Spartinivicinus marinus TaxID=2994442 RepID=UPI00224ECC23|nr:transglutaminase-like cysteine peptidase [Spartinivicinus marinus]